MNKNKLGFYSVLICVLTLLIGVCSYFLYYFYTIKDSDVDTTALVVKERSELNYDVDLFNQDVTSDNLSIVYVHDILDKAYLYHQKACL